MKNNIKNQSKIIQNPSKIDQTRPQIDENASLERFRRQIVPRSAPGAVRREKVTHFDSNFSRTCRSKGRFWDLWKVENRSKIVSQLPAAIFPLRALEN